MAFRFETANERWSWYLQEPRYDGSHQKNEYELRGELHMQDEEAKRNEPIWTSRFWYPKAWGYAMDQVQFGSPLDAEALKQDLVQRYSPETTEISEKQLQEIATYAAQYSNVINTYPSEWQAFLSDYVEHNRGRRAADRMIPYKKPSDVLRVNMKIDNAKDMFIMFKQFEHYLDFITRPQKPQREYSLPSRLKYYQTEDYNLDDINREYIRSRIPKKD